MIVKLKCCFLKKGISPVELKKYGFETLNSGGSYTRVVSGLFDYVIFYNSTRRFIYQPFKISKARKVKKLIKDLVKAGLIEIRPCYEWLAIIGKWQNYSIEKLERIEKRIEELNKKQELKNYEGK